VDVILDDGFFLRENRARYIVRAGGVGARAKIHFMNPPVSVVRRRLEKRNARLPQHNFKIDPQTLVGFLGLFEPPSECEGAEIVVTQDATHPTAG
jgi:predicted kinase